MSATTSIDYPNRIQDRHTLLKVREIIDHVNSLKPDVSQHTTQIAGLQTQLQKLEGALHSAFPAFPVLGTGSAGASAVAASMITPFGAQGLVGPLSALLEGLGPDDGVWYAIADYAHIAHWTTSGWRLADAQGGYFVDAAVPLGVGYQICDGSTTDYLTPDLQVVPFMTPVVAGRFFRR